MSRRRVYDITLSCQQCGGTFLATRSDARFCGAQCRQRANREDVLFSQHISHLTNGLLAFRDRWMGIRSNTREQAVVELIKLREQLDRIIAANDY
jgi:protein-arginine kinase activator protein McsA